MNLAVAHFLSFSIFLVSPIAWLCFAFFELTKGSKVVYFKLSVLFSILGYSLFPWGDGYERYRVYEKMAYFDFQGLIEYALLQGDLVFYLVSFTFSKLDMNYQFIQGIFVFFGYLLYLLMIGEKISNYTQKNKAIIILLSLLLVNFTSLSNNMRYIFSTLVFLCAVSEYENQDNEFKTSFLFVLSICTHFYSLILLFLYFGFRVLSKSLSVRTVKAILIISLFGALFAPPILKLIAVYLSGGDGFISRKIASYILGTDGLITKMVSSPIQIVYNLILQLPLFFVCYIIYNNPLCCSRARKTFLLLSSFCFFFIYFYSTYMRFSYFTLLYGFTILICNWNVVNQHSKRLVFISLSFILFFSSQIVYFSRIIDKDGISYINDVSLCVISRPVFMIMTCRYSEQDIYSGNENFRIMKHESIMRTMEVISGEN